MIDDPKLIRGAGGPDEEEPEPRFEPRLVLLVGNLLRFKIY